MSDPSSMGQSETSRFIVHAVINGQETIGPAYCWSDAQAEAGFLGQYDRAERVWIEEISGTPSRGRP